MKVIYISYDGMCDPVGASQVLPYIAGLSEKEIEFFLISFEKPEKFTSGEASVRAQIEGLPIRWFPLRYTKNPPVISTLLDLRKMNKLCRRICSENRIDFIHARSYISALAALKMKRTRSIPFLFDMRGFWADERVDGGIWSLHNPVYNLIYRFFKKKERRLLCESALIVSLTHTAKKYMHEQWHVEENNINVIPCAADYTRFSSQPEAAIEAFRLKNHVPVISGKTLLYIGSTGTWYLMKEMFDFYAVFREYFPGSQFLLCVNETNPLTESMKQRFPDEITVLQQVPRSDMPLALSLADYSIMFIKPAFSKKASSPIKLGESLAMGVPVICNAGVGDLDLTGPDGFGVVVSGTGTDAYGVACRKLQQLVFDPSELRRQSQKTFDLSENVMKYMQVYERLANSGGTDINHVC